MSSFTLLNLASREKNPDYHDKTRDMETALAWNAVQKTLLNMDRGDLSKYIKSVKLSDKTIVISTTKPIVNAELKIYQEQILRTANESFRQIKTLEREKIILK
ncbi:DUF721 domain-containing protein [Candidatus Gracilibacteria bacterium]|nr:DUF721 domain-containing protein [Candidatus Gracilibacteria bacterium]